VYSGNRFSEDLYFDNFGLRHEAFEELLEKVARDMKAKGFSVEFRCVEQSAFHCYVKFPDILREEKLARHLAEKILVRIDAQQKKRVFIPEIHTINTFGIYRDILVSPLSIILSQKLLAIAMRKREKGRDFYDVSLLWSRTQPDFSYITSETGKEKEEFIQEVITRCEKINSQVLAKDVEPFLVFPNQSKRVRDFLPFIQKVFA